MNIGTNISKAIKESKWLNIEYKHSEEEVTYFWAAILDIDFDKKRFKVKLFNDNKGLDSLDGMIYYNKIIKATPIDSTHYEVSDDLISKIESNREKCEWLEFDSFNNNILNYYNECNFLDNDPFQKEYSMIPGIDLSVLRKSKVYILNDEQMKIIIDRIYRYDINNDKNNKKDLCISILSIDNGNKKYIVAYYIVLFNPANRSLKIDENIRFNKSFLIDGRRHSLFNYLDIDIQDFISNFKSNYREMEDVLKSNLKPGEVINTRPDLFLLQRDYVVNLENTFKIIEEDYNNNELSRPLRAFFGNMCNKYNRPKKDPTIVTYDTKIDISQISVIYNSLKYPVTYVQGPPGTGKTQTILNVILSAFFNERSVLVCSSNNKPVDGITDKLDFKYNNETILFPFIRLGNNNDIYKATEKIKMLYEYETNKVVKKHLINKIINNVGSKHNELMKLLEIQNKRVEIENYLEGSKKLLKVINNDDSNITKNLNIRIEELRKQLDELEIIDNDKLSKLINPIANDKSQLQVLYFKSLEYIKKLRLPRYKELINICYIEDENERVVEFNKWLQSDEHMKLLNVVFPIIFSTNISAHKLGSSRHKFDLVIMDEAGQCNIAHALIPIARAESLLLVGDPNQLNPVIILEESVNNKLLEKYNVPQRYDYLNNSILTVMRNNDNISKFILLKYHYRCGKKIINFSNERYYGSELDLSFINNMGEVELLNFKNINIPSKNSAYEEAKGIVEYIKRNDLKNVSIITPFVNQRNLINDILKDEGIKDISCGTIHSNQGAENDVIIMSTALSNKTSEMTYKWLKNRFEIINVGVTRAKNKLIISSDVEVLNKLSSKDDDLYNLVKYCQLNGKMTVPMNESFKIEIGKSNGSKNEDEFFKTISQYCTINKEFKVDRNVKFKEIFNDSILKKENKEFDIVLFDSKWPYEPRIVIELNGGEHFKNYQREQSDKRKMEVCKRRGLKLLIIDNSFIKSYEYISKLIEGTSSNKAMQTSLLDI